MENKDTCSPSFSNKDGHTWRNSERKLRSSRPNRNGTLTKDTEPESDAIPSDSKVWITSEGDQAKGTVTSYANSPRSYLVETPAGTVRRNCQHLNVAPSQPSDNTETQKLSRTLKLHAEL